MIMPEFKFEGLQRTCDFQGRSQYKKSEAGWVVVAHDFSPNTWQAKAAESLSSSPAYSTEQV